MATKQQAVEEALREMLSKVTSGEFYGAGDEMDVQMFLADIDVMVSGIEEDCL